MGPPNRPNTPHSSGRIAVSPLTANKVRSFLHGCQYGKVENFLRDEKGVFVGNQKCQRWAFEGPCVPFYHVERRTVLACFCLSYLRPGNAQLGRYVLLCQTKLFASAPQVFSEIVSQ